MNIYLMCQLRRRYSPEYDCIFPDEEGKIVAVKFIRELMDFNINGSSQYKILGNIYENPELLEDN